MTYLLTNNGLGDMDTFRRITERVDPHAEGLIARYAGMNEHGLAITTVWTSKAACDRFTAEHLLPALEAVLGSPIPTRGDGVVVDFDVLEEAHPEVAR